MAEDKLINEKERKIGYICALNLLTFEQRFIQLLDCWTANLEELKQHPETSQNHWVVLHPCLESSTAPQFEQKLKTCRCESNTLENNLPGQASKSSLDSTT